MTKAKRALAWRFLPPVLLLAALLALASPAIAFRGHAFTSEFGWGVGDGKEAFEICTAGCHEGIAGAGPGQFSHPAAVATNDATGRVYVLDQGNARIEVFEHDGKYLSQFDGSETPDGAFAFGTKPQVSAVAIDNACYFKRLSGGACTAADPSNEDVYITDPGHEVIDKFTANGKYLSQLQAKEPPQPIKLKEQEGVAVDAAGAVWAYYYNGHVSGDVARFTNTEPNVVVATQQLENANCVGKNAAGVTVDAEDNVYTRKLGFSAPFEALKFAPGDGPALPVVGCPFIPGEATGLGVDLRSGEVFVNGLASAVGVSSAGVVQEQFPSGNVSEGTGLAVDHESPSDSSVFVADWAGSRVVVFGPEPSVPPSIVAESVSSVTADSAVLEAVVAPHGAGTAFHFEYGRCASLAACPESSFEKSAPVLDGFVGDDWEVHAVEAGTQDLLSGAAYHYRVLARNEHNPPGVYVQGQERVFSTQPAGVFGLPDGRSWELVSPVDKRGALIEAIGAPINEGGVAQASASGDAITYVTDGPSEASPEGNPIAGQSVSARSPSGWISHDVALPHQTATGAGVGNGTEYRFFSTDLSVGVAQPFGSFNPGLSGEASEQAAFLRSDFPSGHPGEWCLSGCYRPLVTGCPPEGEECSPSVEQSANVPPGIVFGEEGQCPKPRLICGPEFVGATPDLSHVVLTGNVALKGIAVKGGLYEWSSGRLAPVSVLPPGEGGGMVSAQLGLNSVPNARNAISVDGSRVVWTRIISGHEHLEEHLYVSDVPSGVSVQLDSGLTGAAEFQTASADGSRVFFTEKNPGGVEDLYKFDVGTRKRVALTENAEVRGAVLGASEDGSYVYFVADKALVPGAEAGHCTGVSLPEAACSLYVWHNGMVHLVTGLSGADTADWNLNLPGLTARASHDGRWLAFMSQRSITGYDNRDVVSAKPDEEVFLYNAETGRVVCASCDPTGARPVGEEYAKLSGVGGHSLVGGPKVWPPDQWLAANVPGWTPYTAGTARYQSRYLSDSGRLFFNSRGGLAPGDVNGNWDVYEYEPPNVGGCDAGSGSFVAGAGGCLGLISGGVSPEESAFLDASESGDDVFFLTTSRLSSRDVDTSVDVYDAHVCTVGAPCIPEPAQAAPECVTEASCKADPSPQPEIFGFPASATFSGPGNVAPTGPSPAVRPRSLTRAQKLARALRACNSKPKRQRAACRRRARRAYGPVGNARRSNRRTG